MTPLGFYSDGLEKAVVQDLKRWSSTVLENPNDNFNGLPACPYAKNAWKQGKVAIIFKKEESYQCLYSAISQFDDNYDLAIVVDFSNKKDPQDFHAYWEALNLFISKGLFIDKDLWVMGFHPKDAPNEFLDTSEFRPTVDCSYALIFIQRLSKLKKASESLRQKGYYRQYGEGFNVEDIFLLRDELYRSLKDGPKSA